MADLTTNLNLQKYTGSSYVNYEDLNANLEKLDALGIDYVTSQGKSGVWQWRKFKSGIAECWGTISKGVVTSSGMVQTGVTFPFTFATPPVANVNAGVAYTNNAYVSYTKTSTTGIDCYVYKYTDTAYEIWLYIHAIGTIS